MHRGVFARRPATREDAGAYRRVLGLADLTSIGVAAIIGAGIFVFLGQEASTTGPAVIISLVLAGTAAALAALSYAEASAILPGNGGAYRFAYAALGSLPAFLVGWLFVNGYVIGNAGVGTGWATFFVSGMQGLGWTVPHDFTVSPLEGGIVNLPSLLFFVGITALAMLGMRDSTRLNNLLVVLKLAIVLFVIVAGASLIDADHWRPVSPEGMAGIAGSTAVLFFAYLGFDTIAATGAEARRPRRDMPIAILVSIGVCTLLYVLMAGAVTGIAPRAELAGTAPVADAFRFAGAPWAAGIITVGALIGLATVAYAFHIASARIFQAMAEDGFLPASLAVVAANGVPRRAALVVGVVSATAGGLLPLDLLIASAVEANIAVFVLVSTGILVLRRVDGRPEGFSVPWPLHVAAIAALLAVVVFGIDDAMVHLVSIAWVALGLVLYGFWAHRSALRRHAETAS